MIDSIIYQVFYRVKNARSPKNYGKMEALKDEPWTTSEVSLLIDSIVREVNSSLVKEYFKYLESR